MPLDLSPDNFDAYKPDRMAALAETMGVRKAHLPLGPLFALAVLAGAFIGFGALFYMVTMTGAEPGYGPMRLLGGVAFCLGLVLVVIAGAELFTGNNLMVMAWAHRHVSTAALLRNWGIVYVGNFAGAVGLVLLVLAADVVRGDLADTAINIATAKTALPFDTAFFRGILCNGLVCLAVWLCLAARSVTGRILAMLFPISAFVAMGFEHSVANMFFLPLGLWLAGGDIIVPMITNLIPVTLGNIVGGAGFIGAIYWYCYLYGKESKTTASDDTNKPG